MAGQSARDLLAMSLKRRDELVAELEALSTFIRTYQQLLANQPSSDDSSQQLPLWSGLSRRSMKSDEVALLLEEARRLILNEKRPLNRSELVQRLEERGYAIIGRDKPKVLGTNVWRSRKFLHIDGAGYWPKDVALPREFDSRPT